jgi:hypothetical protein
MLIGKVELWAKKIGAEVVSVRSNTKRAEAHSFYPAMGYKQIKTQAVYEKRTGGARSKQFDEGEK